MLPASGPIPPWAVELRQRPVVIAYVFKQLRVARGVHSYVRKVMDMKTKLLALMFLVGSAAFAGPRVFFGVGVGVPVGPPAPPVVAYAAPGAVYGGYWGPRPYVRPYWVGPRYYGHRYYRGYGRR
jgi:hypothetical protein